MLTMIKSFRIYSPQLSVEPLGGLANRMRVIASAIHIAKIFNVALEIHWYSDSECNCRFDELFEAIPMVTVIERDGYKLLNRITRRYKKGLLLLGGGKYLSQYETDFLFSMGIKALVPFKDNPLYIATSTEFYTDNALLSLFKPVNDIYALASNLYLNFDENVIGIHIRRTDNIASIAHSPTDIFYELMDREIIKNNQSKFYIATDENTEIIDAMTKYKDRVVFHDKRSIDRSNSLAIKDALVDMFCLSKTKKIVGSYYSSFSEISAKWGGIDLVVARHDNT